MWGCSPHIHFGCFGELSQAVPLHLSHATSGVPDHRKAALSPVNLASEVQS
jgi:hypothetical protein